MAIKDQLIKKFEDEIQGLERELRKELPHEIRRARELGDLSENAEYQAAKERQRLVEARIGMLKRRVGEISLLNLDKLPQGKVGLGSVVHVTDNGGETTIYRLVMPEEADPVEGADLPQFADWARPAEQGTGRRGDRAGSQRRSPPRNRQAHHDPRRPAMTGGGVLP